MELNRADWVFPPEARSVAQARTVLAQRLHDLPREALDVVLLLASELVTNAVRHGAGEVGVHVARGEHGVRVGVDDQSREWPVVRPFDPDALGGRGLVLVDGLASGWGVLARDRGKTVWFTVEV